MSYLVDFQIVQEMQDKISPWDLANVNPASLDLRLGSAYINLSLPVEDQTVFYSSYIDLYPNDYTTGTYNIMAKAARLKPRLTFVGAVTLEIVHIPVDITARVELKTTSSRLGLGHPIAGWIDPGYNGNLTLMLHAHKKIRLKAGARICQLIFSKLAYPCEEPYGQKGHYQNSIAPMKAWKDEL